MDPRVLAPQWINADAWKGDLSRLRAAVDGIDSEEAIGEWLDLAEKEGIDPL